MIVTVMLLVALALVMAGWTTYTLERTRAEQRASDALGRAAEEFQALAATGVDPRTGSPFVALGDLLQVFIERSVLPDAVGELGFVGGTVAWRAPEGVTFRPEEDPDFLTAVVPLTSASEITRGQLTTPQHDHRYIVVPVHVGTGESGALVRTIDMNAEFDALNANYRTYGLVAVGSLLIVGRITRQVVGRMLLPISWVRHTAAEISETDLSRRIPVRGHGDLTALTVTINRMLDRLQAAFDAQRQLLDNVGHELKTPVTIIRGHLELMDEMDPEEVASTRALTIDELDRMGRLVDDLITLAKSEHIDFVKRELVDVGRLTDETLERATALGDRHWILDDLADVQAFVDPQRVTQAWLQLAANAVRYSAEDSTIALGSSVAGDELRLWVRDEGVGIAPDEQSIVLTRFGRASHSAGADEEGAGLGLAIVNSIAQAHQGRIVIDSTPGRGSTFTIVLPLQPKPGPQGTR
ncbi:MAG: HAMP domain-containing sensor histidine kinase [Propionicimonas sp.]